MSATQHALHNFSLTQHVTNCVCYLPACHRSWCLLWTSLWSQWRRTWEGVRGWARSRQSEQMHRHINKKSYITTEATFFALAGDIWHNFRLTIYWFLTAEMLLIFVLKKNKRFKKKKDYFFLSSYENSSKIVLNSFACCNRSSSSYWPLKKIPSQHAFNVHLGIYPLTPLKKIIMWSSGLTWWTVKFKREKSA